MIQQLQLLNKGSSDYTNPSATSIAPTTMTGAVAATTTAATMPATATTTWQQRQQQLSASTTRHDNIDRANSHNTRIFTNFSTTTHTSRCITLFVQRTKQISPDTREGTISTANLKCQWQWGVIWEEEQEFLKSSPGWVPYKEPRSTMLLQA